MQNGANCRFYTIWILEKEGSRLEKKLLVFLASLNNY